ncbi:MULTISPECIES: hypothetical protein [unclassified Nocardiopsis]|uniref:hypothetical protein n=1 Tax=Nocardiopsis TaxID=2013 RepID=UPI00387B7B1F
MKDVRWFPVVTTYGFFGMLLHNWILTSMDAAAREITFGAGLALSWFLFMVVTFSLIPFQGARTRRHPSAGPTMSVVGAGALPLVFTHVLLLPIGLWYTVWYESWGLLPLLVVAELIGLAALAVLLWQRPWRRPEQVVGSPEVPKLLGLRDPARMPPGWCAVVFHRSDLFLNSLSVYPLEVDGDRIGELVPGESLTIGLSPGEHTARIPASFRRSPFPFIVAPGHIVHLHVAMDGGIAPWNPSIAQREHLV